MAPNTDTWWEAYSDILTDHYKNYIIDEQSATKIEWYQHSVVPGLLQTEGYAHAMSTMPIPSTLQTKGYARAMNAKLWAPVATQREADASVTIRTKRQWSVLGGAKSPKVHFIIDESVLYRLIGGKAVLYEQLVHLQKIAGLKHVTLQVLPITQGAQQYPYALNCFTIFTQANAKQHPAIYIDSPPYFSKPVKNAGDLAMYTQAFALLGGLADTQKQSKARIARAIEALNKSTGLHKPLAES